MIHLRTLTLVVILVAIGCTTSKNSSSVATSDALLEDFAGQTFSGFWKSEKFAGEFTDLCFQKVLIRGRWATEKGKYVCTVTGKGEIWEKPTGKPFTISGRSVGREIQVALILDDQKILVTGILEGEWILETKCKMVFDYRGEKHTAWLNIMDDLRIAKSNFLEKNLQ